MKQLVVIFTLWLAWMPVGAQKTLTLEECLKLGIENNLSLEGSRNEMRKAKHLLSENRAKLWPQISAVAGFNDNFNPPVSVTDGSAYGNLYNVTKTLQYNASAGLQCKHSKKCTFYTLRFGCSFAAVNTIKPQLL